MLTIKVNNYKVYWFQNPKQFLGIKWDDIDKPCDETVNFEDNGDGRSKYVYANRVSDGRLVKVAKAVRNYIFMPLLFVTGETIAFATFLYQFMDSSSIYIVLGSSYAMFFIVVSFMLFMRGDKADDEKRLSS